MFGRSQAGVAALRVANGVCVCVDGRGVVDVLHWALLDPSPAHDPTAATNPLRAESRSGSPGAGAGAIQDPSGNSSGTSISGTSSSGGGPTTTSSGGGSPPKAELACWRLEPPFDDLPRLPPSHCSPPPDPSHAPAAAADAGSRGEGGLGGVASGVVCCLSASGRFVASGGRTGSLAVQQLDLTSGLICGEV